MSENIIQKINERLLISSVIAEYIDLKKRGKNYWGLCPFHEDNNPSLSVSEEKGIYKCFVCGSSGNVANFVANFKKISYSKAIQLLAQQAGIDYKYHDSSIVTYSEQQQKLINVLKDANDYFQYHVQSTDRDSVLKYLSSRKISSEDIENFKIGFCPSEGLIDYLKQKGHDEATMINASLITTNQKPFFSNRLTFALSNKQGDIIGFSGRTIENNTTAKYINSGDSLVFKKSNVLYNINNAFDFVMQSKKIFITEGFFDVIAMIKSGFQNTVAIMGTALTTSHLPSLKNHHVYLLLDSDEAGEKATIKSIDLLMKNNIDSHVINFDNNLDPDEYFNQFGKEKLSEYVKQKADNIKDIQFIYENLLDEMKKNKKWDAQLFIDKFAKYLSNTTMIIKEQYSKEIAKIFDLEFETVMSNIPHVKTYYNQPKSNINHQIKETNHELPEKVNTSYKIIVSMISNRNFIDIFIEFKSYFLDVALIEISKYLISVHNNKKPFPLTDFAKKKIEEIQSKKVVSVRNSKEFEELLVKQKKYIDLQNINKLNVKLKNSEASSDAKANDLESMRKIKRKGWKK